MDREMRDHSADARNPGSPMTRRRAAMVFYAQAMAAIEPGQAAAHRAITGYVHALNDECAHYRATAAALRAELEAVRGDE